MKKIRFRTWDSVNGKMYYPDRVSEFNDNNYCIEEDGDVFLIDGDGERHYKNGLICMSEIKIGENCLYIGDIIDVTIDGYLEIGWTTYNTKEPETYRGKIVFNNYSYGIEFEDNQACFMYLSTLHCDEITDWYVIGNIYQDNKLLNGDK